MPSNFMGELLGTMFLIILGDGVVANVVLAKTKGNGSGWIVITTGWAMAVVIGVFIAISAGAPEADINPAVTIGKWLILGVYSASEAIMTMVAQLIGAFLGAVVVWLSYFNHWGATPDPGLKLAVFSTGPAISNPLWNVVTEVVGTIVLLFGVGAIFSKAVAPDGLAAGLGPYLVGMLVWGIGLSLGGPTGYAINPARDLGPRIAHQILPIPGKGPSGWGYGWIPVVGPLVGGVIGAIMWNMFF
ncbi:MAG TPA: MIP/aquaporin family protein [Promineifilum sp.]|nr:MIP/aquaporin family protein [Promineifilum sp.]HRO89101.1 MIP/aquaporin family protein [Promineifilum sp.]HRQ12755.1 MIP/aquaporin family protein [Promineifilum sp.]